MVKLNLGCGIYYKPGYVNIDKFEPLIADKILDINQLPYEENSIDEIEASHILEHFDCLQIPYVLSEWFRILKSGGQIFLETPHLTNVARKVRHAPLFKQLNSLRFLFGIDLGGNVHKMGFTPTILKKILSSIGFCNIRNLQPQRFTSEKGLRIMAEKPNSFSKFDKNTFITAFRQKIWVLFANPSSLLLEAIENNLIGPLCKILPHKIDNYFTPVNIKKFLANATILNPQIALIFSTLFDQKKMQEINLQILQFLREKNAPSLFLGNWIRWKKTPMQLFFTLTRFYAYWTKKIEDSMGKREVDDRDYQYLLTGGTEHVDYFSPETILLSAIKQFNQGIKAFSMQDFDKAKEYFLYALKLDPTNSFVHWNLARLSIQAKSRKETVQEYYRHAMKQIKKRNLRQTIKNEMEHFNETGTSVILPVQM